MKSSIPDPSLLREYLLGRLDDKEELESDLSERILLNDELSDMVGVIEDEIIEEYLDGALNTADRTAADEYFLRPLQRKEKLRFAEVLRRHFETTEPDVQNEDVKIAPVFSPRPRFLIYGQF